MQPAQKSKLSLLPKLIYSVLISLIVAFILVLGFDTLFITFKLQTLTYQPTATPTTFTALSEPIAVRTKYFHFQLPGIGQFETTSDGKNCLVYSFEAASKLGEMDSFLHEQARQIYIPNFPDLTCIDSRSYEILQNSKFLYKGYNLMIEIVLVITIVFAIALLVGIWVSCQGWCDFKKIALKKSKNLKDSVNIEVKNIYE